MICTVYRPLSAGYPSLTDAQVTQFYEVEKYEYHRHWYEIGSFTMTVPAKAAGVGQVTADMIMIVTDYNSTDCLVITAVLRDGERITLSGYDLKVMLSWRQTLFPVAEIEAGTYGYDVSTGQTSSIIGHYIDYNCISSSVPERNIYGLRMGGVSGGLENDTFMSRMEPVSDVVEKLCKNADIGYDIRAENEHYTVYIVNGTDRTNVQTDNHKMVFAEYVGNSTSLTVEEQTSERRNIVWAINGGDADEATITAVANGASESGFLRRETVTTTNCTTADVPVYALKDAGDYVNTTTITVEGVDYALYGSNFDVGDKITVLKNGGEYDKRVLQVTKEYFACKKSVSVLIGDIPKKKVLNRLNSTGKTTKQETLEQKIEEITGESSGSGVGKFANDEKNSEIFNDYRTNICDGNYNRTGGLNNIIRQGSATVSGTGTAIVTRDGQAYIITIPSSLLTSLTDGRQYIAEIYNTLPGVSEHQIFTHAAGQDVTFTLYSSQSSTLTSWGIYAINAYSIGSDVSGYNNICTDSSNNVSGEHNLVGGSRNVVCGRENKTTNGANIVAGEKNTVSGGYNSVVGAQNNVNGDCNNVCGHSNTVNVANSIVCGSGINFSGQRALVGGTYNANVQAAYICIGNGYDADSRANAMTLDMEGDMSISGTYSNSGADYAEYFEWLDGNRENEDRRGLFVTIVDGKIRLANSSDDYILGVVSGAPAVVGNSAEMEWQGRFKRDIFGAYVYGKDGYRIQSEDYSGEEYTPRAKRAEWGAVGLVGQLVVTDDGTCTVNGYCTSGKNGIATASATGYRVTERLNSEHVRIILK